MMIPLNSDQVTLLEDLAQKRRAAREGAEKAQKQFEQYFLSDPQLNQLRLLASTMDAKAEGADAAYRAAAQACGMPAQATDWCVLAEEMKLVTVCEQPTE